MGEGQGGEGIELVVAHYREELNWLRRVPPEFHVTVYDKGEAPHLGAITLPNIGREAHTYIHHIVENYAALADVTVFCQGRPFDHAFDFHATLRIIATEGMAGDFIPFGHIVDTDDARGRRLFTKWTKNEDGRELDMDGFHRALFAVAGPDEYTFRPGAQFAVLRELVVSRPREFYERALIISLEFPDAAHCFERSWPLVFGVENPDLKWLEGAKTAYLKPIKKLDQSTAETQLELDLVLVKR